MTCGYKGRFAGPKPSRQIQAVMVVATDGAAVGRLSSCRHQLEPLPLPAQDQIAREIGNVGQDAAAGPIDQGQRTG